MKKDAVIDGSYRYSLVRGWEGKKPKIVFVMLNPSTADDDTNDPTTYQCERIAKYLGYGELEIVNLFAFRSRDPQILRKLSVEEAIGPYNQFFLEQAIKNTSTVVVAWGEKGVIHNRFKDPELKILLYEYRNKIMCLGKTANQQPLHPLFLPHNQPLVPYFVV